VFHSQIGYVQASAFRPTSIPGLQGWWRSDLGITVNGSNQVQTWADQSGNGNTVAISSTDPIAYETSGGANNLPFLVWAGGELQNGQLISNTFPALTQPLEVFVVVRPTQGGSDFGDNYYIVDFGAGNVCACQLSQATYPPLVTGMYSGDGINPSVVSPLNADFAIEFLFNTTSSNSYVNNVAGTPGNVGSNNPAGGISIGSYYAGPTSNFAYVGYMYEVIVFNQIISSANRANLSNYFQGRYNI
jgi:hypothetical protein